MNLLVSVKMEDHEASTLRDCFVRRAVRRALSFDNRNVLRISVGPRTVFVDFRRVKPEINEPKWDTAKAELPRNLIELLEWHDKGYNTSASYDLLLTFDKEIPYGPPR